jgi:hypothetical protein
VLQNSIIYSNGDEDEDMESVVSDRCEVHIEYRPYIIQMALQILIAVHYL